MSVIHQLKNGFEKHFDFWSFCLGGVLFSTVVSQTLLDFFTILLAIGLLTDFIKQPQKTKQMFKMFGNELAMLAYLIVVLIGYYVNASRDAEIGRGLSKFLWVFNFYIYYYAFLKTRLKFEANRMALYFGVLFLIPNVYAIYTYIVGYDFLSFKFIPRSVGLVNSATYHAHGVALIFIPFIISLFFNWSKLKPFMKALAVAALPIFVGSVMVTLTRGAWLIMAISVPVFLAFINYKYLIGLVIAGVVAGALTFVAWPGLRDRVDMTRTENHTSERQNLMAVNFQIWGEYPWLGIGYGENQRRNREYWDREEWQMPSDYIVSHAHNQFLNVLSTTGLAGLFCYLLFYVNFLAVNVRELVKAKKDSYRYSLLLLCLVWQVGFTVSCLTDVTFEYAKLRVLVLLPWALLLAIKNSGRIESLQMDNVR